MAKRFMTLFLVVAFVLTGCSFSASFGDDTEDENKEKKEDLTLQLTKADEEAGETLENPTYQQIDQAIQADPKIGAANDFSVYLFHHAEMDNGKNKLILLAINRLPMAIHNMEFTFSMQNEDGEYIYEDLPVQLPDSELGTLQQDGAMPFTLDVSDEQIEQLNKMDQENAVLELDDFDYEEAED